MKKLALLVIAGCLVSSSCLARESGYTDTKSYKPGFVGPDATDEMTVKYILTRGHDDMRVILKGKLIKRISGDEYLFSDGTGEITVEIDAEDMPNEAITPSSLIKLYGEIDKEHFHHRIKVDVNAVELIK